MYSRKCMLWFFALLCASLAYAAPIRSAMPQDYALLQRFLQANVEQALHNQEERELFVLRTQAYNVVRIIWENPCESYYQEATTPFSVAIPRYLEQIAWCKQALHKARAFLLELEQLESFQQDSGLQLALALSYYLDSYMRQYDKMAFYLQRWEQLGHEIPKNLVKMTDYKDSMRTIIFLSRAFLQCKHFDEHAHYYE